MERKIIKIEKAPSIMRKKKVAAYARVSSGKDSMLHSLSAQVSYYSNLIQSRNGWEYAGVYSDEAISGTKETRDQFQKMIEDCRDGNIDMIITKSISRFARNTVTLLQTIRELKDINIGVFFEQENIYSLSGDGELMITILASFAQEESLSVSENCKWRIRNKFKEGYPSSTTILGYKLVNGVLQVIPEEAEIVKMIFSDYISGMGKTAILKKLINEGKQTKLGGSWSDGTIYSILRNEKYTGNLLLQKTFNENHINKKKCKNNGILTKYYVQNSHEAIIDIETFNKVQLEITKRAEGKVNEEYIKNKYPFSGKLICMECGKNYRRKINNSGTKYAKPVWICTTYNTLGKTHCASKHIPEWVLLDLTAEALELNEFNIDTFENKIKEIRIVSPNTIIYVFRSGKIVTKTWEHKSRESTWSESKKQEARENELKRRANVCNVQ